MQLSLLGVGHVNRLAPHCDPDANLKIGHDIIHTKINIVRDCHCNSMQTAIHLIAITKNNKEKWQLS